jgi:preprotein translocase subunit SecG
MESVLIVIHLMIVLAMVGAVLLQRSEGGALGIGGGGGGGLMTGRGAASALTRATAVLAAAFFLTSITLTLIASSTSKPTSIIERAVDGQTPGSGEGEGKGLAPLLLPKSSESGKPEVPQSK